MANRRSVSRWERRFRAPRVSLPAWAADSPDRCVVTATARGVVEIHSWDRGSDALIQATARRHGTRLASIDPGGDWIWWFDDVDGDERGIWRRQPFGSAPGERVEDATGLGPAFPAGLAFGRGGLAVVGLSDKMIGSQIHLIQARRTGDVVIRDSRLLYEHEMSASVGCLSADGELLAITHSEHGNSRHPRVRVLRVTDGTVVGELHGGAGQGVRPLEFAPLSGDPRLLIRHEAGGQGGLQIWDPIRDFRDDVDLVMAGEVRDAHWYQDGQALLIAVDHQARTRLYTTRLEERGLRPVGPRTGTVLRATTRPDGDVWALWSSAADPPAVRDLRGGCVLAAQGRPAPPSVPIEDVWVQGPGGPVHALLRRPTAGDGAILPGPLPLFVDVHGGPATHDIDAFRASPSLWVDHGFAVVQVNYRGSTGYGSAWRDALENRIGHTELEDVVAVRDHLVASGIADPDRVVLSGTSWGGFLTLLGLGVYPDRWTLGMASVPIADYALAYDDEMESLKAFDRSLFGGSPDEVPGRYRDASPITYVEAVRAPVLILAGDNDSRCPIRQILSYTEALSRHDHVHELYRYDAGHGSLVDDERISQAKLKIDFVRRHMGIDDAQEWPTDAATRTGSPEERT
ncbi:dienelactone hydrolase [Nonomuraea thailandensis]|uniref:Dienelactone hydrolase n=1 Tax=Nonomuraea thailandensis TaxID=1188745 RepID=A0A9X2G9H8_9ACTN|nr:prolyl oligopeptidase family serine peptidase [Nonomuraea thailandensis]MCP2353269.1 dienelactone hydrolase [Nonomuraea thailandensis]